MPNPLRRKNHNAPTALRHSLPSSVSLQDDIRGSSNCIVTVCIGEAAHGLERVSVPLMRDYARRIGVDFRVIRDVGECQHPKYAVMQVGKLFNTYERILYLDADLIIRPTAHDIFEAHPAGKFYARNEAEWQPRSWCVGFHNRLCAQTGSAIAYDGIHFNGGVQLADRAHRALYEMPPWDVTAPANLWTPARIVKNQPWFNFRRALLEIPFAPLDAAWNCLMNDEKRGEVNGAHFWHFATEKPRKIEIIERFMAEHRFDPRRVCMVTVAIGDNAGEVGEITMPALTNYCLRCGYDLHIITEVGDHLHPVWTRFDALPLLDNYDLVIYIDNDVLIKKCAPPLSWFLPADGWDFAAFDSGAHYDYIRARARREYQERAEFLGVECPEADGHQYPNAGVCAFAKSMRDYKPRETLTGWRDQTAIAFDWLCGNLRWHKLGREWNWGHLHIGGNRAGALKDTAYFVHWTGIAAVDRPSDMREFMSRLEGRQCAV